MPKLAQAGGAAAATGAPLRLASLVCRPASLLAPCNDRVTTMKRPDSHSRPSHRRARGPLTAAQVILDDGGLMSEARRIEDLQRLEVHRQPSP